MTEVVAALIWEGEKFMICQRPAHKARGLLWEFVGGKVELGETKEQALIRECREELAVTVSVGDVFTDVLHEYPDITVHLTLFNAAIADGIPQKLEHNDIQWITPGEIPPQLTWVCPLVRFACFHAVSAPRHLLPELFSSTVSACSAFVCGKNCGQTAF